MESLVGKSEFKPVGRCIYCDRLQPPLRLEHIIPLALKGEMLLPEASCESCAAITGAFEGRCCAQMFNVTRAALGYPSRNRGKKHPKKATLPLSFIDAGGQFSKTDWPSQQHPSGLIIPQFSRPPERLCVPPQLLAEPTQVRVWRRGPKEDQLREIARQIDAKSLLANIDLLSFARLLAKIGHGMAAAMLDREGFRPYLLDLILGRSTEWVPFVGGDFVNHPPAKGRHYARLDVYDVLGRSVLGCKIRLFAELGGPIHIVAVGELTDSDSPRLRTA